VGRETALAALVSAVQAAELGEQVVGLVAGEPGIGKTRLVREMAARVSSEVVWGACWEGDGAPPYWVWLQALRAIGGGDLEAVAGEAEAKAAADLGGAARFRLFDGVTEALASASRDRPLVLVLEDLHWADEASVRLLEFLGQDRRPRRLAVIGTYRDTDLDPAHPLARRLGDLARDGLHLSLGGLGRRDVTALVEAMGAAGDVVPLLHRRSGGNPFFLRELVRLWHDEGRVATGGPADDLASAVPAGARPVVARRLGDAGRILAELLVPEGEAPATTFGGWPFPAVVAAQQGELDRAAASWRGGWAPGWPIGRCTPSGCRSRPSWPRWPCWPGAGTRPASCTTSSGPTPTCSAWRGSGRRSPGRSPGTWRSWPASWATTPKPPGTSASPGPSTSGWAWWATRHPWPPPAPGWPPPRRPSPPGRRPSSGRG
jgi:hypothetical protein